MFDCTRSFLTKTLDVSLDRVVGFGSDGAAVMTGKRNGVAAKFKEIVS